MVFSSKLNVPLKNYLTKYFEKDKFTVSELFTIKSSNGRRMAIPSVSKIPSINFHVK